MINKTYKIKSITESLNRRFTNPPPLIANWKFQIVNQGYSAIQCFRDYEINLNHPITESPNH